MRPLTHIYRSILDMPSSFTDIVCQSPDALTSELLHQVTDDKLNCINETDSTNIDLEMQTDLRFREIF